MSLMKSRPLKIIDIYFNRVLAQTSPVEHYRPCVAGLYQVFEQAFVAANTNIGTEEIDIDVISNALLAEINVFSKERLLEFTQQDEADPRGIFLPPGFQCEQIEKDGELHNTFFLEGPSFSRIPLDTLLDSMRSVYFKDDREEYFVNYAWQGWKVIHELLPVDEIAGEPPPHWKFRPGETMENPNLMQWRQIADQTLRACSMLGVAASEDFNPLRVREVKGYVLSRAYELLAQHHDKYPLIAPAVSQDPKAVFLHGMASYYRERTKPGWRRSGEDCLDVSKLCDIGYEAELLLQRAKAPLTRSSAAATQKLEERSTTPGYDSPSSRNS